MRHLRLLDNLELSLVLSATLPLRGLWKSCPLSNQKNKPAAPALESGVSPTTPTPWREASHSLSEGQKPAHAFKACMPV